MSNVPLVSVVIPTFNTPAKYLLQSISSVLKQTYNNIELVIVDDSSDFPFSGVDKQILSDRITWVRSRVNSGVSAARNRGVELARGNWVAFLDADDWWDPKKISKQISALEITSTKWSYVGANITDSKGSVLRRKTATVTGDVLVNCLREFPISGSCSSVVIDRIIFTNLGGFDTSNLVVEDWDFWIRCAREHPVVSVNENLTYIRQHDFSRSSNSEQQINRVRRLFEKHATLYEYYNLFRFQKSHIYYIIARHKMRAKKYGPALFYLIRSLILDPRKLKTLFSYFSGYFG